MSHVMGTFCPVCGIAVIPEGCPEPGCTGHHGLTYVVCPDCREAVS